MELRMKLGFLPNVSLSPIIDEPGFQYICNGPT